ncbi:SDR family NAD(P)-dependent oxidoreductase [Pseudonocardia zijingensis]|uniref:SDR family NAD(P)-dependent oxidoreductase n=1 Tax=Pseudonocardia zijingensis TaxID=153376 RepID=UPI0031D2250E
MRSAPVRTVRDTDARRARPQERAQHEGDARACRPVDDLDALYAAVAEQAGQIDVLVANAGIGIAAPLGEITEEQFDAMFTTNVKGSLFTVQKALPLLSSGASITLTGSTAASRPELARPIPTARRPG